MNDGADAKQILGDLLAKKPDYSKHDEVQKILGGL